MLAATLATVDLTESAARSLRMTSLLLRGNAPGSVAEIVAWFGAMQAQDMASAMWSLGSRLPGWTSDQVHGALERREAVRTWPMRGTVHLVPPRDVHWMLELTGIRALRVVGARWRQLGLDEKTADRAADVLGEALSGGRRLTRAQCLTALTDAGIDISGQRGYHLLWYASQRAVTCIAPHLGTEQSFVRLDDWVPEPNRPNRDEALAILALRYFRSHGPASREDFARWTGLTVTDAKTGLAGVGDALLPVTVNGTQMFVDANLAGLKPGRAADVRAIAGFDEFMLGYKDRSLLLDPEHMAAVVPGGNGVFQSTVAKAGRVVATWKRMTRTAETVVTVRPLVAVERVKVERAFMPYQVFVDRPLRVELA